MPENSRVRLENYLMRQLPTYRSSHQRNSIKQVVLKHFAIFTGKQLKVYNFIKKRLQHRCFPENIAKFLRAPILKNKSEKQLLYLEEYQCTRKK